MKNIITATMAILVIFTTSCKTIEPQSKTLITEDETILQKQKNDIDNQKGEKILMDYINGILSENNINYLASEITSVGGERNENYELVTINLIDDKQNKKQYGFYKILYNTKENTNKEVLNYQVFCTGDTCCKIEGKWSQQLGYYNECSCDNCTMIYVIKDIKSLCFNGNNFIFDIEKILKEHDKKWQKGNNIIITSIKHIQNEGDMYIFFDYKNSDLNYEESFVISYSKAANKSYCITCDSYPGGQCTECREGLFPPNAIECVCADCKMTITENDPEKPIK